MSEKLLNSMFSRFRVHRSLGGTPQAWGDGIVDQSLSTLWYPCNWRSVSDDELTLFMPSLVFGEARDKDLFERRRLAAYICRRLMQRTIVAARRLGAMQSGRSGTAASLAALGLIERCGVLSSLPRAMDWQAGGDSDGSPGHPVQFALLQGDQGDDGAWHRDAGAMLFELSVLACLDRLHAKACADSDTDDLSTQAIGIGDALIASIYACCNAAYVWPSFDPSHELMTVGAWLGHLMCGRDALLPPPIARYLVDILDPPSGLREAGSICDDIIRVHAAAAVGAGALLRCARKSIAQEAPIFVRARWDRRASVLSFRPWSPTLSAQLRRRLEPALPACA